jgi:tetratricopeptide (TPR) repeat protein
MEFLVDVIGTPLDSTGQNNEKARAFFERAEEVAATDNFDYAIDLYMEGLKRSPEDVEVGHKPLRQLSLVRQARGGKKPSIIEKMRHSRGGKDPVERMLNSERLLARDPENLAYAEAVLRAASEASLTKVVAWIAEIMFQANLLSEKPNVEQILLVRDCYFKAGMMDKALQAIQGALKFKPEDHDLREQLRDISAQVTMDRGKYGQQGDFRQSIKDKDVQADLQAQDRVVKTEDYRIRAVDEARKALGEKPDSPTNLMRLADALSDMGDAKNEDQAIELMENAFARTNNFSFRKHSGELAMKAWKRRCRDIKKRLDADPENSAVKTAFEQASQKLAAIELKHYKQCVDNYPTDAGLKYQLGLCYLRHSQFDEAIPMFQEARRDPRNNVNSLAKIGVCFFMKGWYTDALDIFKEAIEAYELKDDSTAKELQYNLGRTYEQQGDKAQALEVYRKLAQIDFAYKDVRTRVDALRSANGNG